MEYEIGHCILMFRFEDCESQIVGIGWRIIGANYIEDRCGSLRKGVPNHALIQTDDIPKLEYSVHLIGRTGQSH